ncbi:tetratricopeptide repeat protein [Streptomyces sp. NPDC091412]|uniref:tetratricopeptide repeat protein n=1 Tax=Streptomyces sp. NPDC091412 TaxID=3366002 RepID=UPI00382E0D70
MAADVDGARRVAELCGCLPLALRIAAAQLVADRSLKPADLAADLEDPAGRLDVLDDGSRAVRGVVQRSVRRLAPPQEELFRLLTVNSGPDLSLETAAAISGVGKAKDVRPRLAALVRASLLRQDPDSGRWSMHDVIRAYAAEQAAHHPVATERALRRLLEHYMHFAQDAAVHLNPSADGNASRFRARARAMAWFDAERANLVAAAQAARDGGHLDVAASLPSLVTEYLHARRLLNGALTVNTVALDATTTVDHRLGQARAWNNLGGTLDESRRYEEALDAYQHALDVFRDLGDTHAEARAWNNLGMALRDRGEFGLAEEAGERSAALFVEVGDGFLRGRALAELARTLSQAGRPEGEVREVREAAAASLRGVGADGEAEQVLRGGED